MLIGDIAWELRRPGSGNILTVPDGFVTDLASIPVWLHWMLDPNAPQTANAAIIHDALLKDGTEQRVAAGEFYRALRAADFPVWKSILFYAAVLVGSDNWADVGSLSHG